MKQFKSYLGDRLQQFLAIFAAFGLLLGLLWYRLGSLTQGKAAEIEVATQLSSATWQAIVANPLYAPYNFLHLIGVMLGYTGITSIRLTSTFFAIIAAVLFYFTARQWHSMRVALLASWLFVTSAWFLHVSRLGSPEILLLVSMLAIVVILAPNRNGRHNRLALPSMLLGLTAVLYVPGMIWLVLIGAIIQRKNIREAWQVTDALWMRTLSLLFGIVLLAPLVYAFVKTPGLTREWLGLNPSLELSLEGLKTVAYTIGNVPKSLFVSSSFDPVHWLGHLPLLSSFEIIMLLLGMYFYATHIRAARTRLILTLSAVALLIIGISGITAISLIVPIVYLVVAAGIAYILHLWLKVFPNNPVARTTGIVIILLTVLLTSVYQTRSYFVAWRYNPDTVQSFQVKL